MTKPLVSIIIPVYNVEKYIQKCLDSCFAQTYNNIEVIAVDDGSSDSSSRILDKYSVKEKRLKVFHRKNQGVVVARELGINASKGDYLCFVDSDDWIEKDMIYSMLHTAINNNYDIVTCDFYICNEEISNKVVRRNYYSGSQKKDILPSLLLRKCMWSLCGKLFKRELFNLVEMPYGLKVGEDGLVCFQVHNNSQKVGSINIPFYNYIQRASSVTHNRKSDFSLDILEFIWQIVDMKEKFHWECDKAVDTFLASQIFVYYVNGGNRKMMLERIGVFYGIKQIISFDLKVVEKIGLLVFLRFNCLSEYFRKVYIYATGC